MRYLYARICVALFVLTALLVSLAGCSSEKNTYDLIPYPNHLEPRSGVLDISCLDCVKDATLSAEVQELVDWFWNDMATNDRVYGESRLSDRPLSERGVRFVLDPGLGAEEYNLDIDRKNVTVKASGYNGFLYGIQTIRQFLNVSYWNHIECNESVTMLPCVAISDKPRYAYRGQHLDVSRHFFDVDEVCKYLDIMAFHKLNVLHWHLTDDQGWRIQIDAYPRLTEYGSIRRKTTIGNNTTEYDYTPHTGFYTKDELRHVVDYAAKLGITVIPEVDLPGHMLSALAAYPELGCTGGPYEVWAHWGVTDEVLCVGKENTFNFIEAVLTEVMEIFPSEYINIGGDECPKTRWEECPACQRRIKELGLTDHDGYKAEHYLQSYVTARVQKFLNEHGRKIIGWDEILEGELAPGATVISWRDSEGGRKAASMGHDAIMAPISHFYFNRSQARDASKEPCGAGGYLPIETVYDYEAFPDTVAAEVQNHIIGIQGCLWTEYISTNEHVEYCLLPRLAALSEVQWCDRGRRDWKRFAAALPRMTEIYSAMGYVFSPVVFGVGSEMHNNPEKGCVELSLSTMGNAKIYYTLDGSVPSAESNLYTAPIEITGGCTVKAISDSWQASDRVFERQFAQSKALGHKAVLLTEPLPKYKYAAPESLTDGVESDFTYSNGEWAGWKGDPMSVLIDMNGDSYSEVRLGTLVQKGEDIFPPLSLSASVSVDGKTFVEVGRIEIPMESASDEDGLKSYVVNFAETDAKYLRVDAETVSVIPDWHGARGRKGFLFVDEIVVN